MALSSHYKRLRGYFEYVLLFDSVRWRVGLMWVYGGLAHTGV